MGHYKLTVDAKYGPVQSGVDIADVTIKGVKSISCLSVVVALYPLRVVSSFTGGLAINQHHPSLCSCSDFGALHYNYHF